MPMDPAMPEPSHKTLDLPILELTAERFAPYGSVIAPLEDGAPFGVEDAPLVRGHNGAGIVWDIDVQSGLHLLIRVIRCRVLDHGDLVAELSGKADR